MGEQRTPPAALRFAAVYACEPSLFDWFEQIVAPAWGEVELRSPIWATDETGYYHRTMGASVVKRLFAFERPMSLDELVPDKEAAGLWERQGAAAFPDAPERPINIDSGYLTEAKLVLATTKDREHRLHVARGMYAEVTAWYRRDGWRFPDWTYPDYRRPEVIEFLELARRTLRRRLGRREPTRKGSSRKDDA
ncbi:MAG TPA: hypothetical protein DCQ98_18245 [Planctomycetaceae bacterium]|nr:hypothetical protein [Planctomycetaceae bacterium]HRE99420.1 DUF4416 family protein [Pirellulaceae bacterium]